MLRTFIIAATGVALSASALAQPALYSPNRKGDPTLSVEGKHYSYYLGRYQNERYQSIDGENKGTAAAITQLAFRIDNRSHSSSFTGGGRNWSSVKLSLSETTKFATMSTTWATNITGSATVVYNKATTWPTFSGRPILKPDIWGGLKGQLAFPFTAAWVYTGKEDILQDFSFTNGKLANGYTLWRTSRSNNYYLDGESVSTFSLCSTITRVPAIRPNPGCNDSSITSTSSFSTAYAWASACTYGTQGSTITQRGKMQFSHYSYYTARSDMPVIHALGIAGSVAGVNLGAKCHKLHVDATKPMVLIPLRTLKTNTIGYSGFMAHLLPFSPALGGTPVGVQAAWADSSTKAFSLTQAVHLKLPSSLPPDTLPRRKTSYHYVATGTTGFFPSTSWIRHPWAQYKKK